MEIPVLGASLNRITDRSLNELESDKSAARAIIQAAVSVELFTIPLYMTTMYSIQGTHQINSKNLDYYRGRQWPGSAPVSQPRNSNERAFNVIFSVFIQEMLHLQMAANLATAMGVQPDFTPPGLVDQRLGWICYGPQQSMLPHIIDLRDTSTYNKVRVNLEALNENQIELFRAIEQPEGAARAELARQPPPVQAKYFPQVPFAGWKPDMGVQNLPLFGTIGWMYECLAQYVSIEYASGKSLWDYLTSADQPGVTAGANSVQQDLFNAQGGGHPMREFPQLSTLFVPEDFSGKDRSFNKAIDMMAAITDQGEGAQTSLSRYRRGGMLQEVKEPYREDRKALEVDYPSYDGAGKPVPSADAAARCDSAAWTHYERFAELYALLRQVETWEQWHAKGNRWTADMLKNPAYDPAIAPKNIPSPSQVADALNTLKQDPSMFRVLSFVSAGAIAGVTTVLNTYWQKQQTTFPYPSMVGSGDRVSLCWAALGKAPNLALGVGQREAGKLYHACQGMNLDGSSGETCAAIEIYHTCRGSNSCKAEGGCGFVQSDKGGGSCSAMRRAAPNLNAAAGAQCCMPPGPTPPTDAFSAPSDNKCASFGGCAVPISASQLFPSQGTMLLYKFVGPTHASEPLPKTLDFAVGESVYDKAWQAYREVMAASGGKPAGDPPTPTPLRVALPPST
ncbi:ferritin-like domain-containing protein [Chromobacterium subtsugae]|uniref:ferritin-like domain-containing protein n=1 Tax=Chromobacterium subtsugae TaxID=251747 RepID=UPI00064123EC|nr:ferritin-like domain-containing protein [Chromobacterium subtsugae]